MNNPKIDIDIAEIFGEIKQGLNGVNDRLDKIESDFNSRFQKLEANFNDSSQKLEINFNNRLQKIGIDIAEIKTSQKYVTEQIGDIKGSQKAQIWALIIILATSLLGILVAVGKILFFN